MISAAPKLKDRREKRFMEGVISFPGYVFALSKGLCRSLWHICIIFLFLSG